MDKLHLEAAALLLRIVQLGIGVAESSIPAA